MFFGDVFHHVNFLVEAVLAKLADKRLFSCVSEDVPLYQAGLGKALFTVSNWNLASLDPSPHDVLVVVVTWFSPLEFDAFK